MEDGNLKPLTVGDLMVILAQMDPDTELVVPSAPYGGPRPLLPGMVIDDMLISGYEENNSSSELDGIYLGLGFTEAERNLYDDYPEEEEEEKLETEQKEEPKPEEKKYWHDELIPRNPDDFKKLIND